MIYLIKCFSFNNNNTNTYSYLNQIITSLFDFNMSYVNNN